LIVALLLCIQSFTVGTSARWGRRLLIRPDGSVRGATGNEEGQQPYPDGFHFRRWDFLVGSMRGRMLIAAHIAESPDYIYAVAFYGTEQWEPAPTWLHWSNEWFPSPWAGDRDPFSESLPPLRGYLGAKFGPTYRWPFAILDSGWQIAIPYWIPLLIMGTPLAIRFVSRRRRRLGSAERLCVRCGYDLRASTGRCPECGTPIVRAGRAAPSAVIRRALARPIRLGVAALRFARRHSAAALLLIAALILWRGFAIEDSFWAGRRILLSPDLSPKEVTAVEAAAAADHRMVKKVSR